MKMDEFTFTSENKSSSLPDQRMISGSGANHDYHNLSLKDKSDILYLLVGISGLMCLLGSIAYLLFVD